MSCDCEERFQRIFDSKNLFKVFFDAEPGRFRLSGSSKELQSVSTAETSQAVFLILSCRNSAEERAATSQPHSVRSSGAHLVACPPVEYRRTPLLLRRDTACTFGRFQLLRRCKEPCARAECSRIGTVEPLQP
jgi:hypothetical protein